MRLGRPAARLRCASLRHFGWQPSSWGDVVFSLAGQLATSCRLLRMAAAAGRSDSVRRRDRDLFEGRRLEVETNLGVLALFERNDRRMLYLMTNPTRTLFLGPDVLDDPPVPLMADDQWTFDRSVAHHLQRQDYNRIPPPPQKKQLKCFRHR